MSKKLTYKELERRVRELEASKALREQSGLGGLIESIQAGIVVHGRDGAVIKSNTAAQKMLGLTHEQMLGKELIDPAWTFLREDGGPMPVEEYPVSRVIATKKPVHNIVAGIQRSDKAEPIWVLDTAIPEFDDNGHITQIITSFMDISALKKSEEQYRNLFENTMQEVHLWKLVRDEHGSIQTWKLVDVNPAALKPWGKSRSEIIGKTANEIFSYDATEHFMPIVKKLFSEGTPFTWEEYFPPTGQFLYMTSVPFGEYFFSTGTDITERKQAEMALQKSNILLSQAEEITKMGSWEWDSENDIAYWSDGLFSIFRRSPEDGAPKLAQQSGLYKKDSYEKLCKAVEACVKNGTPYEVEVQAIRSDGEIRTCISRGRAEKNNEEKTNRLWGTFNDITERKKAEEALESNYALLQIAGETALFGGWSVDLEKNICTWSDAVADIHDVPRGYAPSVQEGINFYAPEWREKITQLFSACAKEGIPYNEEMEILTQKGKRVWVRATGKAVKNENDKIVKVQGSFQDITERKQAEAKILHLQKSESLGRMAASVAHLFNNQLFVVMGNLELVLNDLPDDSENHEILSQSFDSAHKAAEVSRQMLRYLGHISGSQTTIDLCDVCRQSLGLLHSSLPNGVALDVDFPDSGPFVHADAGQIQQVLTNLFTNAQESLPDNQGVIGLSIQTISHEDISTSNCFPLDWQPQDTPYACLEISDTGCGISKKDIVKLFDPFYTTKFTGRGMGLSVTLGILKTHVGSISMDSKPECGSVFRVFLPVSAENKPVKHEKVTTLKGNVGNGGTVLLIEDEETVRNMAKAFLANLGYAVIEAQDGVEAVRLFQEHQNEIDFVLSDLTMPRMNGWETLTELRRMGADVPVILASGYDKESVMAGDHPELPQAFLNKPYSRAALKDVLMEVMSLK